MDAYGPLHIKGIPERKVHEGYATTTGLLNTDVGHDSFIHDTYYIHTCRSFTVLKQIITYEQSQPKVCT